MKEQLKRQQDGTQVRKKRKEEKRRERRRRKECGRKLGRGAGERGEDREVVGKSVHVLSIYLLFLSLQHDFEAALAAKDAIIEQLRRDLREMQAKLDVSGKGGQ